MTFNRAVMMLPTWRRNKGRLTNRLPSLRANMKPKKLNWKMLAGKLVTTTQKYVMTLQ